MFASFIFYVKRLHDWKMFQIIQKKKWKSLVIYFYFIWWAQSRENVRKCVRRCENCFPINKRCERIIAFFKLETFLEFKKWKSVSRPCDNSPFLPLPILYAFTSKIISIIHSLQTANRGKHKKVNSILSWR